MFVYIVIALTFASLSSSQMYRMDYKYNPKTEAFYKLHITGRNRLYAGAMCVLEGAKLMLPTSDQDIEQAVNMLRAHPHIGPYIWVKKDHMPHEWVNDDDRENEVILSDRKSLNSSTRKCEIMSRNGTLMYRSCKGTLPFICKVEAMAAYFDNACQVYGQNYQYNSSTGSCYRMSDIAWSWDEGYMQCEAEGAHLVVINSETEQQAVLSIIKNVAQLMNFTRPFYVAAGFRAKKPAADEPWLFNTIFNQTLEAAGFNLWHDNEPNNFSDKKHCGAISAVSGKLKHVDCVHPYLFICEKELNITLN